MNKFLQKFLGGFFIVISLYHIILTVIGYGLLDGEFIKIFAFLKESIRIILSLIIFVINYKNRKDYFKSRKYVRIIFFVLIIYSIGISLLNEKTLYSIFVGIKYDFHFLIILLSSTVIGYFALKKINLNFSKKAIWYFQNFLILIVLIGFVRQIYKFINPEFFQKIGYGPIGDFVFGQKPPIYYRTGPGGIPRRQGLFSGPNNYGYFLIGFLPLIILRWKTKFKDLKDFFKIDPNKYLYYGLIFSRIFATILTLSRSAFIVGFILILILNKNFIKKHKEELFSAIGVFVIGFIVLSFFKTGSTTEHLKNKIIGINSAINNPVGLGLGTAGPAIHHEGSILPENYFIQLTLDIGTIGFLIRILLLFQLKNISNQIINKINKHNNSLDEFIFLNWKYLSIGFSGLLIMGIFLHVFEDSMVNYLFFVPYGLLFGYLSQNTKSNFSIPIKKTQYNKQT